MINMVQIIDGLIVADSLIKDVKNEVAQLKESGVFPKLVVVMVGNNPASEVYVKHKEKACAKADIIFEKVLFDVSVTQDQLIAEIERLNSDPTVHGMIVQLPVPDHIEVPKILKAIDPRKDVDGFTAYNLGKTVLSTEFEDLAPSTPKGITRLLEYYKIDVSGMNVVVIGRSNIVGKPIGIMLLNRGATVSICHRTTKDLKFFTSNADLIVVAAGKVNLLSADMVKEGVIVIDVGTNRLENGKLVGDADFEGLKQKASAITPVPGGVGPMTVANLIANTVAAAKKQNEIKI